MCGLPVAGWNHNRSAFLDTLTMVNMLNFNYGKYIKAKFSLIIIGCVLLYSCREKLLPEIKDNNINYLVVEGLINTGADSTIYTLTRTFKLNNRAIEASIVARQPMSMPLNIAPGGYTATGDLDWLTAGGRAAQL